MTAHTMTVTAPCLSCGTKEGYHQPGRAKPRRTRGLCNTCYGAAYYRDTFRDYPTIYDPSLAHHGPRNLQHPDWWPREYTPEETGAMLWDKEGRRALHAVMRGGWSAGAESREAPARAERWLAAHPEQRCEWDRPDLAMFGEQQRQAA